MTVEMTFQPPPYLPPPSPGPKSPAFPPGLRAPLQGYPQLCPGVLMFFLKEHKNLMENAASQQGQVHRLHLELNSAHCRIDDKEDRLVHLEARLMDLEGRRSEEEEGVFPEYLIIFPSISLDKESKLK